MVSAFISRFVILLFGTLYPAYASYKAVKTKNVKEYVKWMMYWIVFAFFTCIETLGDIFIAWIPFYYELKILFVLWLLSPATKGSSILYRKFIHPQLTKREKEIDGYITRASDQGYSALLSLGSKGFSYATNVVLSTAIKGQAKIADQLRKSYSMNDISQGNEGNFRPSGEDEVDLDDETDNRLIEESYQREMMEKEESGGEKEAEKTSKVDKKEGKARKRRTHLQEPDLRRVEESEEEERLRISPTHKRSSGATYSHKEDSRYFEKAKEPAVKPKIETPVSSSSSESDDDDEDFQDTYYFEDSSIVSSKPPVITADEHSDTDSDESSVGTETEAEIVESNIEEEYTNTVQGSPKQCTSESPPKIQAIEKDKEENDGDISKVVSEGVEEICSPVNESAENIADCNKESDLAKSEEIGDKLLEVEKSENIDDINKTSVHSNDGDNVTAHDRKMDISEPAVHKSENIEGSQSTTNSDNIQTDLVKTKEEEITENINAPEHEEQTKQSPEIPTGQSVESNREFQLLREDEILKEIFERYREYERTKLRLKENQEDKIMLRDFPDQLSDSGLSSLSRDSQDSSRNSEKFLRDRHDSGRELSDNSSVLSDEGSYRSARNRRALSQDLSDFDFSSRDSTPTRSKSDFRDVTPTRTSRFYRNATPTRADSRESSPGSVRSSSSSRSSGSTRSSGYYSTSVLPRPYKLSQPSLDAIECGLSKSSSGPLSPSSSSSSYSPWSTTDSRPRSYYASRAVEESLSPYSRSRSTSRTTDTETAGRKSADSTRRSSSTDYTSRRKSGDYSSKVTSDYTSPRSSGDYSSWRSSGDYSSRRSSGDYSSRISSGDYSSRISSGDYSSRSSGDYSSKRSSGDYSSRSSGDFSSRRSSGDFSSRRSSGDYSSSSGSSSLMSSSTKNSWKSRKSYSSSSWK